VGNPGGLSPTSKGELRGPTPTVRRAAAAQAAVTYVSQTISDPPTLAQVQAINDGLVAAITLLNELRAAVVTDWVRSSTHTPATW
jgi:hypothetical protein